MSELDAEVERPRKNKKEIMSKIVFNFLNIPKSSAHRKDAENAKVFFSKK